MGTHSSLHWGDERPCPWLPLLVPLLLTLLVPTAMRGGVPLLAHGQLRLAFQ